jgi:hypothetical protein
MEAPHPSQLNSRRATGGRRCTQTQLARSKRDLQRGIGFGLVCGCTKGALKLMSAMAWMLAKVLPKVRTNRPGVHAPRPRLLCSSRGIRVFEGSRRLIELFGKSGRTGRAHARF